MMLVIPKVIREFFHPEKAYEITESNLEKFFAEVEAEITKEITEKMTSNFNETIESLKTTIDKQRSDYADLEEKYIKFMMKYEILKSRQIKNHTLASEIFGDDDETAV